MAGIDVIVATIAREAEESAARIVADAETAARATLEAAQASADEILEAERDKLEDDAALARRRTASRCDMIVGQRRLANQQALVQSVVDTAREELRSLPRDEYASMLLGLVDTYATGQEGLMLLSADDMRRLPPDFEARLDSVVRERGGALRIERSDLPLGGGFVLCYGLIDVSCTLDALFEEHADEMRDRVAQLLFQE